MFNSSTVRNFGYVARIALLIAATVNVASAQATKPSPGGAEQSSSGSKPAPAALNIDDPRLKKFLDTNGGYKDSLGGYFDPKAGTYTSSDGLVVDNWRGITAKDGSYKTAKGDWFDAPNHTIHMSDGSQARLPATGEQVRKMMREDIEKAGGYDKTFIVTKMMEQIQKEHPVAGGSSASTQPSESVTIDPRLKVFLDAKGGYTDRVGGYYDPKAGTYTDKEGGYIDNWKGYTYKDGSYKTQYGDYWDAPTKTFKLADGTVAARPNLSNVDAIKAFRDNVEQNGGYDKDFVIKSMIQALTNEHPLGAAKTH